jgi:hypothetical protein
MRKVTCTSPPAMPRPSVVALLALLLVGGSARADIIPPSTEGCKGKRAGDACTFEGREGTCRRVSGAKELSPVRLPDGHAARGETSYNYLDCETTATAFQNWMVAFLWTCALELPVYVALLRRRLRKWWATPALTLALNTVTHPALWFVLPRLEPHAAWAGAEAAVVVVEGLLAAGALWLWPAGSGPRPKPRVALGWGLGAALLANILSASVGKLILR